MKIYPNNPSMVGLPIGAQGAAAIYTKKRRLGRTTQDHDPDTFVVQLAVSHAVLMSRAASILDRWCERIMKRGPLG